MLTQKEKIHILLHEINTVWSAVSTKTLTNNDETQEQKNVASEPNEKLVVISTKPRKHHNKQNKNTIQRQHYHTIILHTWQYHMKWTIWHWLKKNEMQGIKTEIV